MAIKIQKQQTETTEETALTPVNNALAAFSAANLFQVEAPKESRSKPLTSSRSSPDGKPAAS